MKTATKPTDIIVELAAAHKIGMAEALDFTGSERTSGLLDSVYGQGRECEVHDDV